MWSRNISAMNPWRRKNASMFVNASLKYPVPASHTSNYSPIIFVSVIGGYNKHGCAGLSAN